MHEAFLSSKVHSNALSISLAPSCPVGLLAVWLFVVLMLTRDVRGLCVWCVLLGNVFGTTLYTDLILCRNAPAAHISVLQRTTLFWWIEQHFALSRRHREAMPVVCAGKTLPFQRSCES